MSALLTLGLDYPWLWEVMSIAGGSAASDLHPLDASSTPTFTCDNQKCLQALAAKCLWVG